MGTGEPSSGAPAQRTVPAGRGGNGRWLAWALQGLWGGGRQRRQAPGALSWDGTERRRGSPQATPAAPRADADAVLAMALRLLRAHELPSRSAAEQALCHLLAAVLRAPAVYIAHEERRSHWLRFTAGAGPATDWLRTVRVSSRADLPEGRGAAGSAMRSGGVQRSRVADSRFGPWAATARQQGIGGVVVCGARCGDGQAVLLGLLHGVHAEPSARLGEVLQHLVDELAALLERRREAALRQAAQGLLRAQHRLQCELPGLDSETAVIRVATDILRREVDLPGLELLAMPGACAPWTRPDARPDAPHQAGRETSTPALSRPCGQPQWALAAPDGSRAYGVLRLADDEPAGEGESAQALQRIADVVGDALHRLRSQRLQRCSGLRDPRTGLLGRRALLLRLEQILAAPTLRAGGPALCLLELQAIAAVRARWGHDAAESVYYACAMRLREQLGDVARVARAGRAGFALLFDWVASPRDAQRLAERALAALGRPSSCAGCIEAACCGLPVRVGLALAEPGRDDSRVAWQAARLALQRAGEAAGPAAPPVG